jgi:hypothetical protein
MVIIHKIKAPNQCLQLTLKSVTNFAIKPQNFRLFLGHLKQALDAEQRKTSHARRCAESKAITYNTINTTLGCITRFPGYEAVSPFDAKNIR